ncbi:phosphatase PAP2 family protein [Phreatobacter sp.]|uniref:phosphatase PAP2 family protein n=1 Tax=Phreatobacter sp. TaxID=1966341 RepID=UPI003F70035D
MLRAALIAVAFVLAVAIAVIAVFPEDDLAVARLFFAPERGFWLADHGWARFLRQVSMWPTVAIGVAALVSLIQHVVAPRTRQFMRARTALFLTATVLAAPVILVNGVLKEHWERARPVHVAEFGGQGSFTPWWRPGDGRSCTTNCSFVSGESSGAAWLVAPAMLAPPAVRPAALAAAGVYTAAISALRIGFGGHFLSDTLIATLLTLLIVVFGWRLVFVRGPDEVVLAARLAAIGAPLRRLTGRAD